MKCQEYDAAAVRRGYDPNRVPVTWKQSWAADDADGHDDRFNCQTCRDEGQVVTNGSNLSRDCPDCDFRPVYP